jgi:hypothetical protein
MGRFQRYLQQGKRTSGKRSNPVSKQQMCHSGHDAVRKAIWESGGAVRDGAGMRVMECATCTENDKEGRGWERQWQ